METIKETELKNNLRFLKWYADKKPITKDSIDMLYHMLMSAYDEDRQVFTKIALYISGTRTKYTETHYKIVLHFLATNYPEKLMSNLQLFLKFGHINDILMLRQEPVITNRIDTYINYHARFVEDFKNIKDGTEIPVHRYRKYFKFKLRKGNYKRLLNRIMTNDEINNLL